MTTMHEIDYEVLGDDMQFVKIELDPGEAAVSYTHLTLPTNREV